MFLIVLILLVVKTALIFPTEMLFLAWAVIVRFNVSALDPGILVKESVNGMIIT